MGNETSWISFNFRVVNLRSNIPKDHFYSWDVTNFHSQYLWQLYFPPFSSDWNNISENNFSLETTYALLYWWMNFIKITQIHLWTNSMKSFSNHGSNFERIDESLFSDQFVSWDVRNSFPVLKIHNTILKVFLNVRWRHWLQSDRSWNGSSMIRDYSSFLYDWWKELLWQISVTTDPHIFVIATCIWSELIIYLLVSCNKQLSSSVACARYLSCLDTSSRRTEGSPERIILVSEMR